MRKNCTRQGVPALSLVTSGNRSNPKTYSCAACGQTFANFHSRCPHCGVCDTFLHEEDVEVENNAEPVRRRAQNARKVSPLLPTPVSTGRAAWDTALGGGFVRPSSVLLYGPRGVGKSTNALRVGLEVAKKLRGACLFGSAEMPAEHVRMLADRLGLRDLDRLWITDTGEAEDMAADIEELEPVITVWDSIQRFRIGGAIGEVELKAVVHMAIASGVEAKAISLLISQVTKDDNFIGPNGIGHDVDVLLSLRSAGPNLVAVECLDKNRYAPTPLSATEALY